MTEQIISLVLRSFSFFCSRFFVSTPSTISFTSWEIVQAKREASLQFRILTSHTNTLLPSLLISQIPRIPSLRICLQMMYNSLMRQYFSQNRTKPVKLHRKMLEDIQLQFTGGLPSLCVVFIQREGKNNTLSLQLRMIQAWMKKNCKCDLCRVFTDSCPLGKLLTY